MRKLLRYNPAVQVQSESPGGGSVHFQGVVGRGFKLRFWMRAELGTPKKLARKWLRAGEVLWKQSTPIVRARRRQLVYLAFVLCCSVVGLKILFNNQADGMWDVPIDAKLPAVVRKYSYDGGLMNSDALECVATKKKILQEENPKDSTKHFQYQTWSCDAFINSGDSASCIVRNTTTGELYELMYTTPGYYYQRPQFTCESTYIDYINFRVGVSEFVENELVHPPSTKIRTEKVSQRTAVKSRPPPQKKRGIVFSAYPKILPSTIAVLKTLKKLGCTLPIELWSRKNELDSMSEYVDMMVRDFGVKVRHVEDDAIQGFLVKVYAVANSEFEQVLFLDSDNFPVRDPSYLFESEEFKSNGAVFWPDFWHPNFSIFESGQGALLWEIFDVPFRFEFEQESGQVLIDREQHADALKLMLYYARNSEILSRLHIVWGDKDLFRLSFRRLGKPFHMIQTLPALAGRKLVSNPDSDIRGSSFCGQTMVQHDTEGQAIFMHRNTVKLDSVGGKFRTWETIQKFAGSDPRQYLVRMTRTKLPDTCWYLEDSRDNPEIDPEEEPVYEEVPAPWIEPMAIETVTQIEEELEEPTWKKKLAVLQLRWWFRLAYGVRWSRLR